MQRIWSTKEINESFKLTQFYVLLWTCSRIERQRSCWTSKNKKDRASSRVSVVQRNSTGSLLQTTESLFLITLSSSKNDYLWGPGGGGKQRCTLMQAKKEDNFLSKEYHSSELWTHCIYQWIIQSSSSTLTHFHL